MTADATASAPARRFSHAQMALLSAFWFGLQAHWAAILLITLPIILPVLRALDINLVHFGIVMTVNMAIGKEGGGSGLAIGSTSKGILLGFAIGFGVLGCRFAAGCVSAEGAQLHALGCAPGFHLCLRASRESGPWHCLQPGRFNRFTRQFAYSVGPIRDPIQRLLDLVEDRLRRRKRGQGPIAVIGIGRDIGHVFAVGAELGSGRFGQRASGSGQLLLQGR